MAGKVAIGLAMSIDRRGGIPILARMPITETPRDAYLEAQAAQASLRMIGDAINDLFGSLAALESEESTLLRGPELHHRAEAIIEALRRIAERRNRLEDGVAELRSLIAPIIEALSKGDDAGR